MRKHGAIIGKPSRANQCAWDMYFGAMRDAQEDINEFLRNENSTRIAGFLKLDVYLQEISSLINSVDILLEAAASPQGRHLFRFTCTVTPLGSITSKASMVPRTVTDWERVLETAFHLSGSYPQSSLNLNTVKQDDAVYMAQEAINIDLVVHCETKLLLNIFQAEQNNPRLPKACPYIGVSKLSCHGCDSFFKAFNHTHRTTFTTKGSHGKCYYPWQFPAQSFPGRQAVLEATYEIIAGLLVKRYDACYRPKLIPLCADYSIDGPMVANPIGGLQDEGYTEARAEFRRLLRTAEQRCSL
jgi:hypothetical protein